MLSENTVTTQRIIDIKEDNFGRWYSSISGCATSFEFGIHGYPIILIRADFYIINSKNDF